MTVGEALEWAEELRPGCGISREARLHWLREADGRFRKRYSGLDERERSATAGADRNWDDGLREDVILLLPEPFDALYPHYLCGQIDEALGESVRSMEEQAKVNGILTEMAVWMRRERCPRVSAKWKW